MSRTDEIRRQHVVPVYETKAKGESTWFRAWNVGFILL